MFAAARSWPAVLALMWGAGCATDLDKPTPPDTSALLADLASPTGRVSDLPPDQQTAVLLEALDGLALACGFHPLADASCQGALCEKCALVESLASVVRSVIDRLHDGDGDPDDVEIPGVSGILFAHAICPGWDAPSPDPAHGHLDVTLGFTGRGLDPMVWGSFTGCEQRVDDTALRIEGDFSYGFEPRAPVPFDQLDQTLAVFGFEGTLFDQAAAREIPLRLAFRLRLDEGGPRELMFDTLGHGTFVLSLDPEGVLIRGADVAFRCKLEEKTCDTAPLP